MTLRLGLWIAPEVFLVRLDEMEAASAFKDLGLALGSHREELFDETCD